MVTCHFPSVSSRNAASCSPELLIRWDVCRHGPLQRASSSSCLPMPPRNHSSASRRDKSPLLRTVVRARKASAASSSAQQLKTKPSEALENASRDEPHFSEGENRVFGDSADFEFQHGYTMGRVCDRLIEVFMVEKTKEDEWRKLLILSEEWAKIRPYFFKRCKYRENLETDAHKRESILALSNKVKLVDDDMERHNQLLDYVKEHWPELDVVVAGRRKDFSNAFFHHIELLCDATYNRIDKRDDLARVAAKCLAAVEAHDRASEDDVAVTIAQKKFDDILNSPSLDAACSKIDELAKKKQLDSTLMLLIAKAWAAAKESNTMKDEVKELMHHLYLVARGHLQRMIPKEIRILQHILSFEDPTQRFAALTEAFSPGDESIEKEKDLLYTKPAKLHKWIKLVLDAYYLHKQSTLMDSARQLMNPLIISRLLQLKEVIEDQFL